MAAPRTLWLTAAQIAAAIAVGAGADRLAVTTYDTSAEVREVRFLSDGQIAVGISTKIGDCSSEREYVYASDGTHARLNGRPTNDADVLAIGAAAVELRDKALQVDKGIADRPVAVHLLGDGQIAVALEVDAIRGRTFKEMVYAADGSKPRLNGVLVEEKTLTDIGPVVAAFKTVATTKAAVLVGELTKPLALIKGR